MTEQPIPGVNDDTSTWYMPSGDVPDPTEAELEESSVDQMCPAQFDVQPGPGNIVVCTRPIGHEGSHVAGDCDRIIVLWDVPTYRIEEDPA
jgi:hypothetical protein